MTSMNGAAVIAAVVENLQSEDVELLLANRQAALNLAVSRSSACYSVEAVPTTIVVKPKLSVLAGVFPLWDRNASL